MGLPKDVPPLLDNRSPLPLDRPFTTGDARALGVSSNTLTRLVADGLLRRVVKGVYVAAQVPDTLALRCRALALIVPPGAVVTDRTAGWVHGAEVLAPNDHLALPRISTSRTDDGSRLRNALCKGGKRELREEDVMVVEGLPVTTPLRTAWDLGRLLPRDQALAGLDAMARLGSFGHEQLLSGLELFRRRRGVVQLRELAPLTDGRSESPGESALRLRWIDASDLPRPTPQLIVRGATSRTTYRLDLAIEDLRYAAEYDGQQWHSSDRDRARDLARRSILRERGWTIDVFTAADLYGPRADAAFRLRQGIQEARHNLGRFRADPA